MLSPIIADNFLSFYDELKEYSLISNFEDEVNTVDGAVYPEICKEIPRNIEREMIRRLKYAVGNVSDYKMFLRRSPKGVSVPHVAHTDNSMGKYSAMLYLNEGEHGTAFLKHIETGIMYAPGDQEYVDMMSKDQNDLEKWQVMGGVQMKENRCAIFDAGYFHCATPVGGFGEGEESRCVLTCFFDD